ncbi:hypothetical protein [Curtobacterium sp. B8]|uniref:hypothetical protein n=1 Tax=Curtobacterium sp. B8 TaxID=95611 RepID=UPI0011D1D7E6|nr:hypothetical protein [Curtobacterium sp. B8]
MAQRRDRDEQDPEADPDAGVVVHRRRVPEQPSGEHDHDHRQREGETAEESTERVRVEVHRHRARRVEPLDHGTGDGEQDEQEREAVAPLVLLEGLLAEHAEEGADAVGHREPRRHERVLLTEDRGLAGRWQLLRRGLGARRPARRARARRRGRA